MKLYRLNRYRALPMPGPDGEGEGGGGGGDGKEAKGLGALANEGKNEGGESEADLEKWKPKSDADFDQRVLPKHMRDENPHKALANVFNGYKGFRDAQAKAEKPPEKPDGYTFELKDDKLKAHFPDLAKDKAFLALRNGLHKIGVPQTQFAEATSAILQELVESGALPEPISIDGEVKKLGGDKAKAITRHNQAKAWVESALANKVFGDDTDVMAPALQSLPSMAEGVMLIEHFIKARQERGLGENHGEDAGGITLEDVKARMKDPKYMHGPTFDQRFRDETDRLLKQLTGGG